MKEIDLKLSVDEVNQILAALGDQPFSKVYALINKIQQQASSQMTHGTELSGPGTES